MWWRKKARPDEGLWEDGRFRGYDGRAVANRIIEHADAEDALITVYELVKHVYFAHGWNLAVHDRPLVRQHFEVWPYGPVAREVYDTFRPPPPKLYNEPVARVEGYSANFTEEEEHVIRRVYETYSDLTAHTMAEMTYEPGTPWARTHDLGFGAHISNKLIREHFLGIIRRAEERKKQKQETEVAANG